jgi:hypothetical protein
MENDFRINAADSPQLVNQLIEQAFSTPDEGGESLAVAQEALAMEILLPSDTHVDLLAGIHDPFTGEHISTAEIRELNGVDEEALAKIKDYGKSLLAILSRGVVKIGEEKVSKELLDLLLAGDREYLILKIRIATLGKEVSLPGNCPFCKTEQDFKLDLEEDVKLNKISDSSDLYFTVKGKAGDIKVTLPTGSTQKKLVDSSNKTAPEMDSILLSDCVIEIGGLPVMDSNQTRNLSIHDRRLVLKELSERNPGPDLESLKKACVSCGQEVPIPLALADLFRI